MPQIRVLLGFAAAADHVLEEVAGSVSEHLYGNAFFPAPPVPQAALTAALTAFTSAIAAQGQGGTAATAAKDEKRAALIGLLRQLAAYVQEASDGSLAQLLSSGFDAVSTNRAQTPLERPHVRDIQNQRTGELMVRVTAIKNARCYEARFAVIAAGGATGPWQSAGLFTDSRAILLTGLTPGATYSVQVRAIGGSTGSSDWSDPSSHMSM